MDQRSQVPGPRLVVRLLLFVVGVPLLPLLISRCWDWWEAWAYAGLCIGGFAVSRILAARRHPDLVGLRARGLRDAEAKSWDRLLSPLTALGGAAIPLLAGLDAAFGWSPAFGLPLKLAALLVLLGGYALGSYALIENRFFSPLVRIQRERGHEVVSSGPYRWVRHPGYAGAFLANLASPLLLDSRWTFLPAVLAAAALVLRTLLEDRTLEQELAGYREYAERVRYRLLPGVW